MKKASNQTSMMKPKVNMNTTGKVPGGMGIPDSSSKDKGIGTKVAVPANKSTIGTNIPMDSPQKMKGGSPVKTIDTVNSGGGSGLTGKGSAFPQGGELKGFV